MITRELAEKTNCVVAALSAIEGRTPDAIIDDLSSIAGGREHVFDENNLIARALYWRYLDQRGWMRIPRAHLTSVPLTCLVCINGHAFALVDGALYDNGAGYRWPAPIDAVWVPLPSADRERRSPTGETT